MEVAAQTATACAAEEHDRTSLANIPAGIFSAELGTLETVTKYLKENKGLRLTEIALILNRDTRTIWGAYNSSRHKRPAPFTFFSSAANVPLEIFNNRSFGMLESIVLYLKESQNISLTKIAGIVKRDYSTVWTACSRAKTKRRMQWPQASQ